MENTQKEKKEINILKISKKDNLLLKRVEYHILADFDGKTPSREEIFDVAFRKIKSEPGLTTLNKIKTIYGSTKFYIDVDVYEDDKEMKCLVANHIYSKGRMVPKEK